MGELRVMLVLCESLYALKEVISSLWSEATDDLSKTQSSACSGTDRLVLAMYRLGLIPRELRLGSLRRGSFEPRDSRSALVLDMSADIVTMLF